ncbi:MAG: UDP-2,3-diacylglucosamine diphosphatase [Gammaproteobacteria bacterium]
MFINETGKKYTLFIADLHLTEKNTKINDIFLNFLQQVAGRAEALYILGDLFMLWAGDDDDTPFHETVKTALHELVTSGTKVFLMPGNRDFLLGERFARESGCQIVQDPLITNIYGRQTLLTHGDNLISRDVAHRKFRALTQNLKDKKWFFELPIKTRKGIAWIVHSLSATRNALRLQSKQKLRKISERAALIVMKRQKVDQVIHGHIHMPFVVTLWDDAKDREMRQVSLGSWDIEGSALVYVSDGEVQLRNF